MSVSPISRALDLLHSRGIVRARDLAAIGVSGATLAHLLGRGELIRIGRGLYAPPGRMATESDQLVQTAIRYPNAVFCLLTALQVHGLTTQSPHEIWVAIGPHSRAPTPGYPPLRVIRFSDPSIGLEQRLIDGVVSIPVTSVAKTVADCFKFRNKIGVDIAIEALRDAWIKRKATMDGLWEAAEWCRMTRVMRPYLESLV
jgi:predicted transcriptional regulator of viral defense system